LKQKSQKRLVLLTAEDDGTGQVGVRSLVQGAAVCKREEPGGDRKVIRFIVEI
jgi:hypothetical protein